MKKNLHFLCLFIFIAHSLQAQTVSNINTPLYGTSGNVVTGTSNYAASESIYYEYEIGANNFTIPATAIQNIAFDVNTVGTNTTFNNFKIYLKNIPLTTTTLATGTYTTTGYTLVYSGSITIAATGWQGVTLITPFVRTRGTNLEVLIERLDNTLHTGFIFNCVNDASGPLNTRRFNSTTQSASLTVSAFRPSIQLSAPALAADASLVSLSSPTTSCNSTNSFSTVLKNVGTSTVAIGAASVTLRLGGANSYTLTKTNTTVLAAGASETVIFSNVNVGNAGITVDSAYVAFPGDLNVTNDTIKSAFTTATNINVSNGNPAVEGVETNLPVFAYAATVVSDQLWDIWTAPPRYKNPDLTDSLGAHTGNNFFYFDSYSGASSVGFVSRLFSNCITLPATSASCTSGLTFWMSHDNSFATDLDSMYVSISTNKGVTWTRIAGYGRYGATYTVPTWVQQTLSLTAYQGQTFQIGFEGVSKYGNIIGLDDITISTTCIVPVTLSSFKGERRSNINNLEWTTATEANNTGFELQRSADGINFSKLAFIVSKAAAGNSNSSLTYSFDDVKPLLSNGYYRLKQIDKDGKSTLSNIVLIKGNKVSGLTVSTIYPNPVTDNINLVVTATAQQPVTISILEIAGKIVSTKRLQAAAGDNIIQVNTDHLSTGSYLLKATNSKGETAIQKFIKQ